MAIPVFAKDDSSNGLNTGVSLTKQSMKDDVDINRTLGKFLKSQNRSQYAGRFTFDNLVKEFLSIGAGGLGFRDPSKALQGNFSMHGDFKASLNTVLRGTAAFESLPAKTRDFFMNDPALFLEFMADAKNKDKAIELGLVIKDPPPPKVPMVQVVDVDDAGKPVKKPKPPLADK